MAQTKTVVTQNGEKVTINTGVNNGLTPNGGFIQLGGALTKASVLTTTSSNTLSIQGLQVGAASDNVLVSDVNGVLKFVPRASFTGADNLGNHTATTDLAMSGKNINNAANVTAAGTVTGANVTASTKATVQTAQITKGSDGVSPAAGAIAVAADTNGNVKWVPASSIGAGDNLGNHTATTDLAMSGKNINNAANVTATGTVTAANVTASTKATVQTAQITKGSDGASPAVGAIAVAADTNGNVKWVPASSIGAGDNLGNHTATTDLAMSGKNINNAANVTATGTVAGASVTASTKATVQTAQITKGSDGLSPAAGAVAVAADTNGNVKWVPASNIGAGDNLGNHTATRSLDMEGHAINNSATADDTKGIKFDAAGNTITQQQLQIKNLPDGGQTDRVLTVDDAGNVKRGPIDIASIAIKYKYLLKDIPVDESISVTTPSRSAQYMVTVSSTGSCWYNATAVFMVYNGYITYLGGEAAGNEYTVTRSNLGTILKLDVTVPDCYNGIHQYNFDISVTNNYTIKITNRNGQSPQSYRVTVLEN